MQKIRIGTRGSRLALWQANYIEKLLRQTNSNIEFERIIIKTEGDRDQHSSLAQIGGQGVFTKAIEEALIKNRIDAAVHSLKDLPSVMPDGLILAAVPERGPAEDALVTKDGLSLNELAEGASVATGSIRRCSQLLHLRPDLDIQDLRGNIETRLNKLYQQNLDGIIMARAALYRLELDHVKYYSFNPEEMVPGVGQGAVGVQIRADDAAVNEVVRLISHQETFDAVTAERAFLNELDSGCQFPVGAYARVENDRIKMIGFVGSDDGETIYREKTEGTVKEAEKLGRQLAQSFIKQGAQELLAN
ncbi:MAG: hydroxymethylbilane synthase [Calditrichaceae bacterium]|nr:hydroxymethylbilane synthase [Calditrichaceae bacterium]HES60165.1 hydroxymethylbilane synthase [Caldithrix sp.]